MNVFFLIIKDEKQQCEQEVNFYPASFLCCVYVFFCALVPLNVKLYFIVVHKIVKYIMVMGLTCFKKLICCFLLSIGS